MQKLLSIIKNKYYLSLIIFFVWMLFLDRNDFVSQYEYRQKLSQIRKDQDYYKEEIIKVKKDVKELSTDPAQLEKFAREKYLMKRDGEDIFIIVPEDEEKKDK
ncbi:septum formation initiator family protein [Solitalea sp. MAHUQ-68]|uniref:Septum formation initiator family protein n=1 Tax=Solitalea agri TaxID=2953739 RepID=A0A9X2F0C7_9SPHI|nr:septum formation initiator family protein [Solitalea agri]MCO4291799.1 septum formation initiator family protein [Solitalea agri]